MLSKQIKSIIVVQFKTQSIPKHLFIAGPSLPYKLEESAMTTSVSPNGIGVILFGGMNRDTDMSEDTILELHYDSSNWTTHPQKLKHRREGLTVIPFPSP